MSDAVSEAVALQRWLFDVALPLWWNDGADRMGGGFHEAIGLDGRALPRPHRARAIARQAFSYCEAGRLGWDGPWREAQRHALDYFRKHFVTADATVVSVVDLDGKSNDARFDLYNQAFALLAYASGHRTFGEADGWRAQAVALRTTLEQSYAHALGGFVEDRAGALPQRANPHMHLLEAALAWIAVDDDPVWHRLADGIAALCLEKFVDSASGALREFLPPTGRRRRAWRDASASLDTITNGHFCSIAGRGSPAGISLRQWRVLSHSPIRMGSMRAAAWR
jgi:mannose/cellobiose epimerase-like protein (N-acyl-D-glucosamine 2-epimerase family)